MTAAAVPGGPAGARRRVRSFGLSRDETADGLMLLALTIIGITGFRDAYGGYGYLAAGAAGALLGVTLSHLGHRARLPLLAVAAVGMLAFLALGGLVSQPGRAGAVPTPVTMQAVVDAAIHGWKELLTTARPVGTTARLLVLPYLLGVASGVAGHALARRTARVLLPAVPPAAVAALSILFGAGHATAALLQGAGFAGLALAWAALRQQRGSAQSTIVGRQRPWQRLGAAAAVLAVAVAGASFIGPRLPGAHAHQRVVLRTVPPFDVTAYPSPLAAFRDYTQDASASVSLYGKQLLSTSGLAAGTRIRIAAMDTYDGLVWGVANAAADASSFSGFQRVGATLPGTAGTSGTAGAGAGGGPVSTATITVDGAYQQPWLPDLAGTTGFAFTGPDAAATASALRFNVATTTGIIPGDVPAGLRYRVSAASAVPPTGTQLAGAAPYGSPDPSIVIPPAVQAFAEARASGADSPMAKVLALAAYLRDHGRYSDGGGSQSFVTAGHSAGRLTTFLQSSQIVGDGEQYAATMALLANAVGVPARVALDGTVEPGGGVYGRDVHADVELHLAQYGWVTLPASQFTGTQRPTLKLRTSTPPPAPAKVVPPQAANVAPVTVGNQSSTVSRSGQAQPKHGGFRIPAIVLVLLRDVGLPLLVLALIAAGLAGAKASRRRRRRSRGPPAARVAGAWRELLDLGRDLGMVPAVDATRREQAGQAERHGLAGAAAVAVAADAAVFGPADPDAADAARIWALAEQSRQHAVTALGRWRRAWVTVNPASLWASRAAAALAVVPFMIRLRRPDALAGGIRR
jgi:Transglutaminase-like superfamily